MIAFLLEECGLASEPERFLQIWTDLMVHTWGWNEISARELFAHLPSQYQSLAIRVPVVTEEAMRVRPFLAPSRPFYPLIGRGELRQRIMERLLSGGRLALTALNGKPGIGKTALAVDIAHDLQILTRFSDGVLWAGMGKDADDAKVLSELTKWAMALGMSPDTVANATDVYDRAQLVHGAIGMRKMLLVIDDIWDPAIGNPFYQLGGPACAHLLTTRKQDIALDFGGHNIVTVTELSVEQGVQLLSEIAPAAVDLEPERATELVEAVGGLPFSLVLMGRYLLKESHSGQPRRIREALARLHEKRERLMVTIPQLIDEYNPSFPSDVPLSLFAAIALSDEDLPDETTRRTLYAMSALPAKPNSFAEEAAMAIAAAPTPEALDTLTDCGLMEDGGPGRYTLHQTVADYASLMLSDQEVYERLVNYYVNYATIHGAYHKQIEIDLDNIDAALMTANARAMQAELVQGANAVFDFLETRGLYGRANGYLRDAENVDVDKVGDDGMASVFDNLGLIAERQADYERAETYLKEGLSLTGKENDTRVRNRLLLHMSMLAIDQGDYKLAEERCREAIRQPVSDDLDTASHLLQILGIIATKRGDYKQAKEHFQEAMALARELGDSSKRMSAVLGGLAEVAYHTGSLDEAAIYYRDGLEIAEKLGYRDRQSYILGNLGAIAFTIGKFKEAEEYYKNALAVAEELGLREQMSFVLYLLGVLQGTRGASDLEAQYYEQALPLAREIGHKERIAQILLNWGALSADLEQYNKAMTHYREGLATAREIGSPGLIGQFLTRMGVLADIQNQYADAEQLYEEALSIARQGGIIEDEVSALCELGEHHLELNYLQRSEECFREALMMAERANLNPWRAQALFGLARVADEQQDSEEALALAQESLAVFRHLEHRNVDKVEQWLDKRRH